MVFEREGMLWDTDKAILLKVFPDVTKREASVDMAFTVTDIVTVTSYRVYKTKNGRYFMVTTVDGHAEHEGCFSGKIHKSCESSYRLMRTFEDVGHMNRILEFMGFRMSNDPLPEA